MIMWPYYLCQNENTPCIYEYFKIYLESANGVKNEW